LEILEFLAFRENLEKLEKLFCRPKEGPERARAVNLVFLDFRENQKFLKNRVSFLAPDTEPCGQTQRGKAQRGTLHGLGNYRGARNISRLVESHRSSPSLLREEQGRLGKFVFTSFQLAEINGFGTNYLCFKGFGYDTTFFL
jgi:hypothetical protein